MPTAAIRMWLIRRARIVSLAPTPASCDDVLGGYSYFVAASTDLHIVADSCHVRPYAEACQFEFKCFVGCSTGIAYGTKLAVATLL